MTTKAELIAYFVFAVVDVIVLLNMHRQWRKLRHDKHRFTLFSVRDRLYLMVAEGKLSSDDLLFRGLRAYINSTLCWAEEIGALELVVLLQQAKTEEGVDDFKSIWEAYTPDTRKEVERILTDLQKSTMRILRYNSNLLRLGTVVAWFYLNLKRVEKNAEDALPRAARRSVAARAARTVRHDLAVAA